MAITETRSLPAQFIEDIGKDYAKQLAATTSVGLDTSKFAPTVAGQDVLQKRAASLAGSGVGSFAPFIQEAQKRDVAAGQQAALSGAQLGAAGTTLAGAGSTLGGIAGLTGAPTSSQMQQYMSPYQSQVIDTTLSEFDRQKAIQEKSIADQAIASGAFGGDVKVYKEQSLHLNQEEIEQHYRHNYYNKVLVKLNKLDNKIFKTDLA